MRRTQKTGKKADESVTVLEKKGVANGRTAAICSTFDQTAESNGNRRVNIKVDVERRTIQTTGGGDPLYQVDYYAYVVGVPKKTNFWGDWVNYSSGNTIYSRFSAVVSVNTVGCFGGCNQWQTSSLDVNDTRNNDGTFIDYGPVIISYYNVRLFYLQNGWYNYTSYLTEGSPLGLYTSGGVPDGVQMKCP